MTSDPKSNPGSNSLPAQQQQHQQQASHGAPPTAPYPPMWSSSSTSMAPPIPKMSVLRSTTPLHQSPFGSETGESTSASMTSVVHAQDVASGAGVATTPSSFGRSSRNTTTQGILKTAGQQQHFHYPPKIRLCPFQPDLYACIHCTPTSSATGISGVRDFPTTNPALSSSSVSTTPTRSIKKVGPSLVELRQVSNHATITTSRGNPSLGMSVASTCLDFHPSELKIATGLTTGALCIHHIPHTASFGSMGSGSPSPPHNYHHQLLHGEQASHVEYFATRYQRPSTSVAWRPHYTEHVAVGLVGSITASSNGSSVGVGVGGPASSSLRNRAVGVAGGGGGGGGGGDRDFCCLLWDVTSSNNKQPHLKLSHNAGVSSLTWLKDGQTLCVGTAGGLVQLYDVRTMSKHLPPTTIRVFPETVGTTPVDNLVLDPNRSHVLATSSRQSSVVKLWDLRRLDSSLADIKLSPFATTPNSTTTTTTATARTSGASSTTSVNTIAFWNASLRDDMVTSILSVVLSTGSSSGMIQHYNTMESRPTLVGSYRISKPIHDLAVAPPDSFLVVPHDDRTVRRLPKQTAAPLAVSPSAVHSVLLHAKGKTLWSYPMMMATTTSTHSSDGTRSNNNIDDDVSMLMRNRSKAYSMNPWKNISMLAEELKVASSSSASPQKIVEGDHQNDVDGLLQLWNWIARVERLCGLYSLDDSHASGWSAKLRGIVDAGVAQLLELDNTGDHHKDDSSNNSNADGGAGGGGSSLSSPTKNMTSLERDSPHRQAAMLSCGWTNDMVAECESIGHYERAAALAVWQNQLELAVEVLQRASTKVTEIGGNSRETFAYFQLVSMCIAGYPAEGGESGNMTPTTSVWRNACKGLLEDLRSTGQQSLAPGASYLAGICTFLLNDIGRSPQEQPMSAFDLILKDDTLDLCDRVAFACRYLERKDLSLFVRRMQDEAVDEGRLEGIILTGLHELGLNILQSYVDRTGDVQSAAFLCSRIANHDEKEKRKFLCATEWLDAYRTLLNTWQMWQVRAMFDVDRAELLRNISRKQQLQDATDKMSSIATSTTMTTAGGRRVMPLQPLRKQLMRRVHPSTRKSGVVITSMPAQLDARCNYCSKPLSTGGSPRTDRAPNNPQWLSKQKPILSCCPHCRKPLPRCAVCLLSLGCLNPYVELRKLQQQQQQQPTAPSNTNDGLANLPLAEWFTWCMRCKHGGHAHHMVGWFAHHQTCPVSGCKCNCTFDDMSASYSSRKNNNNNNNNNDQQDTG